MANITPRKNKDGSISYLIRVYVDENSEGKQKVKSMTWKPPASMTSTKKIEKELQKIAALFEEQVKKGLIAFDGNTTFAQYSSDWISHADIAVKTKERYIELLKRINQGIGHIRLSKLEARHIREFEAQLRTAGVKKNGYAVDKGFKDLLKSQNISNAKAARLSGVAAATVSAVTLGKHITVQNAEKLAAAFGCPVSSLFELHISKDGLSDKTILHHHRLISRILGCAKKERLIPFNVASEHMDTPKVQRKEAEYLDDKEAQQFVSFLLQEQDLRTKTALVLLIYTGVRRGELCGLEWRDIDREKGVINIMRASQYQRENGITTVPTKNASSVRAIRVPDIVLNVLDEYEQYYNGLRQQYGTAWTETGRLFVRVDKCPGTPINPDTINFWLDSFTERNGLRRIHPHTLRHTFATLQISTGVSIRTVQARTGHAQASTLINIYTHAIKAADEAATEALDSILTPVNMKIKDNSSSERVEADGEKSVI